MRRLLALALAVALLIPATAVAAGWTIVKKATVTVGQYGGGTNLAATITHPHALAIRLIHATGDMTLQCQGAGGNSSDWSKQYGPGLHTLPHMTGKAACTVSISISGTGKMTGEILKR